MLNNNANVQAVSENTLGITAANFWTDTTYTSGGITLNKKSSVLVRNDGPFIDVSVSDPTQLNTGGIALQIALDGATPSARMLESPSRRATQASLMNVNTAAPPEKPSKPDFTTSRRKR